MHWLNCARNSCYSNLIWQHCHYTNVVQYIHPPPYPCLIHSSSPIFDPFIIPLILFDSCIISSYRYWYRHEAKSPMRRGGWPTARRISSYLGYIDSLPFFYLFDSLFISSYLCLMISSFILIWFVQHLLYFYINTLSPTFVSNSVSLLSIWHQKSVHLVYLK